MSAPAPARPPRKALSRFALWLALLATFFASLAPTFSHAMAAAGHDGWVQVCTAQGMRWVALEADAPAPTSEPTAASQLEHCPVCSLATQVLGCPPALGSTVPQLVGRTGPPERFQHAPRTAHAWVTAQPRAPPAGSAPQRRS